MLNRLDRASGAPAAIAVIGVLLASAACGGKHPRTTPAASFHREVTDPIGDATPMPDVSNPPDMGHGIVDVANGQITFTVHFVPSTFDRESTRLTIELDTDQDPLTGIRTTYGLGIDYILDLWPANGRTHVMKAAPQPADGVACKPCYVVVGNGELAVEAGGMTATVPLALIGSADGRVSFRVLAYSMKPGVAPASPTKVSDFMPDVTLPPARVP
ncbi:MAG TPA: hypothetical protein VH583_01305 [Vicinamibacterales bacterium]